MGIRRGFTLVELAAVIASGTLLLGLGASVLGQPGGARDAARQLKDSTQVRGIVQGMVTWAQNNGGDYPLPSKLDTQNFSVADRGTIKDNTANIYSLMVFNGTVSTEIFVSPVEKNPNIKVYEKYEFDQPRKAAKPAMAIWDPAFSVDFTDGRTGAASYAHLQPSGGRAKNWGNTSNASCTLLGMRGPEVSKVTQHEDGSVTPVFANSKSMTFGAFDDDASWSGNMAFNDNHVSFLERTLAPGKRIVRDGATYTDNDGKKWPDLWNYDEPDDPKSVNNFLGIFTRAGGKPADFKAIWD